MNQSIMALISIFFPILWGIGILIKPEFKSRKNLVLGVGTGLIVTSELSLAVIFGGEMQLQLFSFGEKMNIYFQIDDLGRIFALIVNVVWVLAGFYAF